MTRCGEEPGFGVGVGGGVGVGSVTFFSSSAPTFRLFFRFAVFASALLEPDATAPSTIGEAELLLRLYKKRAKNLTETFL